MKTIKIKDLGTEPVDDATLISSMTMLTAIQVHKKGDVGKAATIYSNVLKHNSESSDASCLLGMAAYDNGMYDEAEKLMRKATELDPNNPDYQLQIGRVYNKQGKKDLALEAFSKAIVTAPRPDAFIDMGDMAFAEEKFEQAENCYKQAISMAPDEHSYYYKLADYYQKIKKIDLAIETWGIALTYAVDDNYQRFMLVRLCLQNKYKRQALEHISVLIANKDDLTPQVQLLLAPICHNLEDYEGAALLWQAVINRTPQRSDLYLKVGDSYYKIKKYDSAIIAYRLYLDEYDYAPKVYKKLAKALFNVGHANEAFECMRIAIDQGNNQPEFFITLATMYQKMENYDQALSVLYEADKLNPNNEKILNLIEIFKQLVSKAKEPDNQKAKVKAKPKVKAKTKAKLQPHGKPIGTKMKQSAKANVYDLLLSQVGQSSESIEPKARAKPKPKPKRQMARKPRKPAPNQESKGSRLDSNILDKLNRVENSKNQDMKQKNIKQAQPKVKAKPSNKANDIPKVGTPNIANNKSFKTSTKKDQGLSLDVLKDILQDNKDNQSEQTSQRERLAMDLSNKMKSSKDQKIPRKVVTEAYNHTNFQGYDDDEDDDE